MREDLVRLHLPLCRSLAARYAGRGEPLEDLIQAACVGLINAAARFDPSVGVEFRSYAVPTILGELKKHFRDTAWAVRVPRREQELRLSVAYGMTELTKRNGRTPSLVEVAEFLEMDEQSVRDGMDAARAYRSTSLATPMTSDGEDGLTLGDTLGADDPALEDIVHHESLGPLIAALPPRSRRILLMRFYGNQTQRQIATHLGISQMHVSRLLASALERLREDLLAPG